MTVLLIIGALAVIGLFAFGRDRGWRGFRRPGSARDASEFRKLL
jgi:hypothetical protein